MYYLTIEVLRKNYEMLDITLGEIDFFKNQLLSKGYSYDDETKTITLEL